MKEQILKLAKMKDEASFYRAFPTEEAFMAKYGKKLQKLKLSENIKKANWGMSVLNNVSQLQKQYNDSPQGQWNNAVDNYAKSPYAYEKPESTNSNGFTTNTDPPVRDNKYTQNMDNELSPINDPKGNPTDWGNIIGKAGPWGAAISAVSGVGDQIGQSIGGKEGAFVSGMFKPEKMIGMLKRNDISGTKKVIGTAIPGLANVFQYTADKKIQAKKRSVDDLIRKAATSKDVDFDIMNEQMKWRPEDNTVSPGELYPQYFAKDGGTIQSIAPERFVNNLDQQLIPVTTNLVYNPELSFNRRGTTFRNEADEIDAQLTLLSQKKKLTNKDKAKIIELENNKRLLFDYQENDDTKKFRTGGNIRRNEFSEVDEYAMGGDLQLYDGNAEMMSNNPYSPEEGDTMMLKGPSHAEGGMNISYGGNPVEAEGGEPVMKGQDGDLTIFGNMKIGKELIPLLGDKNAKGKKFKNYIADLSREEEKHSKLKDKSVMKMGDLEIQTPLDKLKANSFKYNAVGADSKLADIAEKKQKASALQTAMLDTANEIGIDPDALSRGQIKKAKMGANIPKADDGIQVPKKEGVSQATYDMMVGFYNRAKAQGRGDVVDAYQKLYYKTYPEETRKIIAKEVPSNLAKQKGISQEVLANPDTPLETLTGTNDNRFGIRTAQMFPIKPLENIEGWDDILERLKQIKYTPQEKATTTPQTPTDTQEKDNKLLWMSLINSALPYLRPTDAEELDPRQLAGEMYALSTNQLEPVQAQTYQPELSTPYEISLQDQLNEITADKRSAERMSGYNPAAQSYIASQAYGAKSKVLADQMRINQAMKDKTFGENRNLLNQAKLQNLQILDNQYTRQAQAKSNTKDINQAALSSIASKYQQNELERKTLQTYENMYNYRFGNNMRAQNWNGPALFNEPTVGSIRSSRGEDVPPEGYEYVQTLKKIPKSETSKSNGGIVSAYRKL